jgi:hypothetical protein
LKINAAQNGQKLAVVGAGEEGYDHFDKLLKRNEEVGKYVYLVDPFLMHPQVPLDA